MIKAETDFKEVYVLFDDLLGVEKLIVNVIEQATSIIVTRAKQIITEKQHVITGTLRRSVQTAVERIVYDVVETNIGSHVHYAYYVENLPDGGYLFEAFIEKFDDVVKYIKNELRDIIEG